MYKHILIATDGSELAERGVVQGLRLAKALGASATAVFVTEPWEPQSPGEFTIGFPIEDYDKAVAATAARVLAGVDASAKREGVACRATHVKNEFAAEGIIKAAKDGGCDLIVMASHGRRGLTRLLLGSQATKVVTLSTIPVLICR